MPPKRDKRNENSIEALMNARTTRWSTEPEAKKSETDDAPRQAEVVPSPQPIPTHQTPATRERMIPEFQPLVIIEPIDQDLLPKQANDGDRISLARFVTLLDQRRQSSLAYGARKPITDPEETTSKRNSSLITRAQSSIQRDQANQVVSQQNLQHPREEHLLPERPRTTEELEMEIQKLQNQLYKEKEDHRNSKNQYRRMIYDLEQDNETKKYQSYNTQRQLQRAKEKTPSHGLSKIFSDVKNFYSKRKRVNSAIENLTELSNPKSDVIDVTERQNLLEAVNNKLGFTLREDKKMNAAETIRFFHDLKIPRSGTRALRKKLKDNSIDILSSEYECQKFRKKMDSEISLVTEDVDVVNDKEEPTGERITVTTVKNVKDLIERRLTNLLNANKLHDFDNPKFKEEIWMCLVGDKGGESTKVALLIGNQEKINAVENATLLGIYNGADTPNYLHSAFKSLANEVKSINSVTLNNGYHRKIRWFSTGDVPYCLAIAGRKGHATKNPYIQCLCTHKKDERFSVWNHEKCIERTLEELNTKGFDEGQIRTPLFSSIGPKNYIPGTLHTLLGIGTGILDEIEDILIMLDTKNLPDGKIQELKEKRSKLNDVLRSGFREKDILEDKIGYIEEECSNLQEIINVFMSGEDFEKIQETGCNANTCFEAAGFDVSNEWLECDCITKKWYHKTCLGLTSKEYQKYKEGKKLHCDKFDNRLQNVINRLRKIIEEKEKHLSALMNQLQKVENSIKRNALEFDASLGPLSRTFTSNVESSGATKKNFFQKYTGNHLHKLLQNTEMVKDGLPNDIPEINERFEVLEILSKIQSHTKAGFLDPTQKQDFLARINELLSKIENSDSLKQMPATVKWHNLLKTLPNFLEAYNTVGYFSEQPIENMHAKTNSMKKRMCTRNVKKVQEWLIKNIWYENFMHDTKPSDKPLAPIASMPSSKIPKIVENFSPREQPVKERPIAREEQEPCSSYRTRESHKREQPVKERPIAREEQEPCSSYRTRESHKSFFSEIYQSEENTWENSDRKTYYEMRQQEDEEKRQRIMNNECESIEEPNPSISLLIPHFLIEQSSESFKSSTRTRETAREEQEPCSKYRTRGSHEREQPVTRETTPEPTLQHVPSQLGDIFPHVPSSDSDFLVYPDVPQDDPGPSRQRKARGNRIAQSMLNDGSVRFSLH